LDTPDLKASEKLGLAFANRAGCGNQTTGCLRALSAAAVLAHSGEVNTLSAGYNQSTVDGQVLHESLRGAFEHGRINRVPVLQGNNSDEVYLPPLNSDEYRKQMRSFAKAFGRDPHQAFAIYSLKRFSTPALAVGAAVGDAAFECSAQASNRSLSKWVPTYAYEFSDTSAGRYGSMHGAEQRYLFRINNDFEDVKIDPKDARQQTDIAVARALGGGPDALSARSQRLSEAMRLAWTAFARNGNPDTPLTPKWPLVSDGVEMLDPSFSGALPNSELRTRHHCDFWNSSSSSQ
jgi:para-nitrobenzyl esterase